jgi:hypothetical protein
MSKRFLRKKSSLDLRGEHLVTEDAPPARRTSNFQSSTMCSPEIEEFDERKNPLSVIVPYTHSAA